MLNVGSPPHTWGTPNAATRAMGAKGITPTYVGNTYLYTPLRAERRDHPHIRGEHIFAALNIWKRIGSPPHTWGTLALPPMRPHYQRITPTYVGNTVETALYIETHEDHPHIRGEHTKQIPSYRTFKFRNGPNFFNLHSSLNLSPSNQPHYTNFTTAKQAIPPKEDCLLSTTILKIKLSRPGILVPPRRLGCPTRRCL